jgi:hypothetical protein
MKEGYIPYLEDIWTEHGLKMFNFLNFPQERTFINNGVRQICTIHINP